MNKSVFLPIISFVISAVTIMCSNPERQIDLTYEGQFIAAVQVDLGDPMFYKVSKYYVYTYSDSLGENVLYDPIALNSQFVTVLEHDSLEISDNLMVKLIFKSKKPIFGGIVFASGSNQFNNTRFSAGQLFKVRIVE